jgi:hypothetical protein
MEKTRKYKTSFKALNMWWPMPSFEERRREGGCMLFLIAYSRLVILHGLLTLRSVGLLIHGYIYKKSSVPLLV